MPNNTLDMYTSDRVYDGTRPIPAGLAAKLRARHAPPAIKRTRFAIVVVPFVAMVGFAIHYVRALHHG